MADDAQFDPLAGILTPQTLQAQRQAQLQAQYAQAGQLSNGMDYGARSAGLALGAGANQAFGQNGPQDQLAAQNQQLLAQPSQVQGSGDSYTDQASKYDELAKRFLAAGQAQQASKFVQAAQIVRQEGLRAQVESSKAQMDQAKMTEDKAGAQWVVVDSTPDKYGIPQYKRIGAPISLFNADGSVNKDFQAQRQQAMDEAEKSGAANPTIMRADQLENSKSNAAAIRANQAIATAGIRAASQTADAGGSLDPDTKALAVSDVLSDASHMHNYAPYGKSGQARRDEINSGIAQTLKAADIDFSQLNAMRAQAKGDASAIAKLGPQLAQIKANEELAKANGDRVLELVDSVNSSQYKSINSLLQAAQKGAGGPDTAEFASVLATFQAEAARIVNGSPTGAGVLSDSARHELQQVVDGSLPPAALKRVINRLYVEFSIRQGAIANSARGAGMDMSSIAGARGTNFGGAPQPTPGAPPQAAPGGPPGAPQGGVRIYNPATGTFQ